MQITKEIMEWILFIACSAGAVSALAIASDLFKPWDQEESCKKKKRKRW